MPRRYRHLTFEERCQVEIPKKSGLSRGSIAQHPDNSRAARYALLVAVSGLTGKIRISSHYIQKRLHYKVLINFSNSS